jgi:NADH:ubiquinone oxidoreductase subunit 5 (subunit L)/multisubunit Na+/H+ antiporter MnhA subunit
MFHAVNHSVAKAMLFLAAGNTLAYFHTKSTHEARGTLRLLPVTGILWIVGLLAITGSPPFGAFASEFAVLKGAIDAGRIVVAVFYLAALSIVFVGMSAVVLPIVYGTPKIPASPSAEGAGSRAIETHENNAAGPTPDKGTVPFSSNENRDSPLLVDSPVQSKVTELPGNIVPKTNKRLSEPLWSILPPILLAAAALFLGLYMPQPLSDLLHNAAKAVGAE